MTRPADLRRAEAQENFPVAMRVLPRRYRQHLQAIYDVVRVIDNLGDAATGDRTQLLLDYRRDLAAAWATGAPQAPELRRLVPTVSELQLDREPFDRLVEANLQDQRVATYETFDDVVGYCRLSADPIGRLVLAVFGCRGAELEALSDNVCTALQLVEHWQDVGEDNRNGRIYLPQTDLATYGVTPNDLLASSAPPALRRLLALEVDRAESLLDRGAPLVAQLSGWARIAVAGYVAGGRAAIAALRRSGYDVLPAAPRGRKRDLLGELARLLVRRSR